MTYFAYRAAIAIVPRLPEAFGYWLFARIGDLIWLCSGAIRDRVAGNLERAVGRNLQRPRLAALTRASLRNLCWNYYELFRSSIWDIDTLGARLLVDGEEHLAAAHAQGRGVVLMFAHVGSLEAITQVTQLFPHYHFVGLIERMKDVRLHELLRHARSRRGLELFCVDEALRAIRHLRRNAILVVGADRDMTKTGVLVPFFGSPARLPVGAIGLALRFDVPVMLVHSWRETAASGHAVFRIRVHQPFTLARTGDLDRDTRSGVALVARELEPVVRARPDQWLANYGFWPAA